MAGIQGLYLTPYFISPQLESDVIQWLDQQQWSTKLARRTQHYGFIYEYKARTAATPTTPITGPLLEIANIFEMTGVMTPQQCIVNEYLADQGISAHIDSHTFGKRIISVSLNADAVMTFTRGTEQIDIFLPRLSAIMLEGPARNEWKHEIKKRKTYIDGMGKKITKSPEYRRISLTYRTLA